MKSARLFILSLTLAAFSFVFFSNNSFAEEKKAPAASKTTAPAKTNEKSLYDRLGGLPALVAVTEDLVPRLAADTAIMSNKAVAVAFAKTNVPVLKFHIITQLCQATGGPCKYVGRDMKTSHKGLMITETEWSACVVDLTATLDKLGVPQKEQSEVTSIVGSLKKDIVGQ